jgi:hypothetical protein
MGRCARCLVGSMPTEGLDRSGWPSLDLLTRVGERIEPITHLTGDETLNDILTQGVRSAGQAV